MSTINPIPDSHRSVTPYLTVKNAAAALAFYRAAFGATETMRLHMPNGAVGHAEFTIGASHFMIADEYPAATSTAPHTLGGSCVKLHLYVADVDAFFARAIAAGAVETMPPADQFWGDRMGALTDPFGHHWMIASHLEDVDPADLQSRMDALFAGSGSTPEPADAAPGCEGHYNSLQHGMFSWCELLTSDAEAAKTFYSSLFGWQMEPAPTALPGVDYTLINCDGHHIGGLMAIPADKTGMPPHWGTYVTVDDVDATAALAQQLGGAVCLPPQDIPEVGRFAVLQDPQNAVICVIQYVAAKSPACG
ncbi:VOC family protein [Methylomonas sp. HYX-M1]|uniref:VOC family protein n=1 Tax=Methylomonas sp. HYX-M1 TaxID=3139307 RepID=UPI00345C5B25